MGYYRRVPGGWECRVRVYDPDGKRVSRKHRAKRKSDLEIWEAETTRAIREGRQEESGPERTVGDLLDSYLRHGISNLKGELQQRRRRAVVGWWRKRLGRHPVAKATPPVVVRVLDKLDVAPSTRNRYKSALAAVYALAIKRGELSHFEDPTVRLHEPERDEKGASRQRTRWLDADERRRLLDAVDGDPELRIMVRLAITTGMREGEITAIRWRWIDQTRMQIALPGEATKNGRPRSVPLVSECARRLAERGRVRRMDTDLVFPGRLPKPYFPRMRYDHARAAAGLEDVRFHDLRHTAASIFLQGGASLAQCAELLGCTFANVQRYGHLVTSDVADLAREKMAGIEL